MLTQDLQNVSLDQQGKRWIDWVVYNMWKYGVLYEYTLHKFNSVSLLMALKGCFLELTC